MQTFKQFLVEKMDKNRKQQIVRDVKDVVKDVKEVDKVRQGKEGVTLQTAFDSVQEAQQFVDKYEQAWEIIFGDYQVDYGVGPDGTGIFFLVTGWR